MSSPSSPAHGLLTPAQWEERLVAHYLRSDGPSGGGPLTFIDATPAELAVASQIEGLDDEAAQAGFIAHFKHRDVSAWLSGHWRPPTYDTALPGYFRFLVLTALVSATDAGAGKTHNFRIRLGELLGSDGPFNSVAGVNTLWCALANWCERKRVAGEPFRRVQLPSPGNATLIGRAVQIAFPSWTDRSTLTQVLRRMRAEVRRSPSKLTQELARPQYAWQLSPAVTAAYRDFDARIRGGRQMLSGHRFWRLVESIDARLSQADSTSRDARWRLELQFDGYELDIARLSLFLGAGVRTRVPSWEGALQELEGKPRPSLPAGLAAALDRGMLIAAEEPGLTWMMCDGGAAPEAAATVVARRDRIPASLPVVTSWRRLEGDWVASGRLAPGELVDLRRALGLTTPEPIQLTDLSFEGGVRTDRTSWLGRPGFLPSIRASSSSEVSLQPVEGAEGNLIAVRAGDQWRLTSTGPVNGRWRVTASELGADTERVICLERCAPEHRDFPSLAATFEAERDALSRASACSKPRYPSDLRDQIPTALDDALEAVYAGPAGGWPEGELVRALAPAMPCDHFIWDFIRALAEAEWLDPVVLRSWRARVWRLRPPALRQIDPGRIVATGAVGAAARRRLAEAVKALDGRLRLLPSVSDWAPPIIAIEGLRNDELADAMGWPIQTHPSCRFEPAPRCWPPERRSGDGRQLQAVWSFEIGLFLPPTERSIVQPLRLERLVRERGDDRDVYRVLDHDKSFVTASRTAAIVEAHRLARRPLFHWKDGRYRRRTRSGHLPLEMARALAWESLSTPGPVTAADGSWSYHYPAAPAAAGWVADSLGAAVLFEGITRLDPLAAVVAARRSGARRVWTDRRKVGALA